LRTHTEEAIIFQTFLTLDRTLLTNLLDTIGACAHSAEKKQCQRARFKSPAKRTWALGRNSHSGDAGSFVFREEDMISFDIDYIRPGK